jgi:D-alanyl-lipoteichoic acid acyltransferase DltB (MBOAT superfamily)
VFLLLASMAFNFAWAKILRPAPERAGGGERVPRIDRRRLALGVGIAVNLGLLAYFKYADFLIGTLNAATASSWPLAHIALPLAISFFTFEQITYLVAAQRGEMPPHGVLHYGAFITFFPRLIAGPIVRPHQMLPQLTALRARGDADDVATGLFIFAIGLFKKVVIADTFAPWVAPVFEQAPSVSFVDAWGAALAFGLQIYFDFSGYSDMAIGLARMFGIALPENFESPYQAHSIIDFWRRWHMTLSNFLRDYLYIPLGGNRRTHSRTAVNVFVTMLLGGLWHGAGWTFVVWGALHGALLSINQAWRRTGLRLPAALAWALTFTAVTASWVFFRAPSFERASVLLAGLCGQTGFAPSELDAGFGLHEWKRILPALALVLLCPNRRTIMAWRWNSELAYAGAFAVVASVAILRLGDPLPFFYFRF